MKPETYDKRGRNGDGHRDSDSPSPELLEAAREAFARSFELTAAINAVLAIGTAIGAAVLLRGVRGSAEA